MDKYVTYTIAIVLVFFSSFCFGQTIKGLSFVGTPDEYKTNPLLKVKKSGSNWISVIPFAHTPRQSPKVHYKDSKWRWWGETKEGVIENIKLAHAENIKVMIKPQLYVPGDWPGGINFDNEADWVEFEKEYTTYIMQFVDIGIKMDVEMICIATELKISVQKREKYWRKLIGKIKAKYKGKLIYASNWDNYYNIPFWDALDYIGIDAYFPLTDIATPSKRHLIAAWQPTKRKLKAYSALYDKKIIFTEFGYLSIDQCAHKTWLLEKKVKESPINELAQANAYDALYQTFWHEDFWEGGFLWKWFPEMKGHEGYIERDYTPQGKLSEKIITKWFAKN